MAELPVDQGAAPSLETLGGDGDGRFDPVRWRFIEALARRSQLHQGEARRIIDGKLAEALAAYRQGYEQAKNDAKVTVARISEQSPDAANELQRLLSDADFGAVKRFTAGLEKRHSPLAELTRYLAQLSPEDADGQRAEAPGVRGELKAIRNFRKTWSKLSVDKQVAQAIEQAPDNAGPLNSHMLVLRSLALMRDISPDYLSRFMSYVDTLLWLDQAEIKDKPAAKKALAAKSTTSAGRSLSR